MVVSANGAPAGSPVMAAVAAWVSLLRDRRDKKNVNARRALAFISHPFLKNYSLK
jgi:hypothetical protein